MAALASSVLLSACQFFAPPTGEQTLVAENKLLGTELASIRATATVDADRMMITLEHAQTEMSHVGGQTEDLSATLIARGSPAVDISRMTPQAATNFATPDPNLQQQAALDVTPIAITPGSVSSPADGQPQSQTNSVLVVTPIGSDQSNLASIVTAPGVGDDDCAMNPTNQFTTGTPEIYVVARARNIVSGDNIISRWYHEGAEMINHPWTPDFDISDACIWFYIDQSEVDFTPGNWEIQMELNGVPIGAPINFAIMDETAAGDALLEQAMGATTPTALP